MRRRFSVTRSGSSSVRMPRLSESYGPSADPALAGGEEGPRRRAARPIAQLAHTRPCASSRAVSSSSSRPDDDAVELAPQRLLQRTAQRRALRHAGREQIVAVDLEPHVAQLGHPAQDRLRGGAHGQRESQRDQGLARPAGRAAPTAVARWRRSSAARRGATRPARLTASRSQASRCRSASHRSRRCGAGAARAASAASARSAPIATAPSAAEATSSSSASQRRVQGPVDAQLVHALDGRGRLGLAQQVHQLVAHARPRDRATARLRRRIASQLARFRRPCGSRAGPRSARPAAGASDRPRSCARAGPGCCPPPGPRGPRSGS